MVLVKNLKMFALYILSRIGKENVFDDILQRKKTFRDNKNINFGKMKNCIFPNELGHGFGRKFKNYLSFFQRKQGRKKCLAIFFTAKKESKTCTFQRGWSLVIVKILKFVIFFLGKISKKNVFDDILHSKRGFLSNINISFKRSKNFMFSKGFLVWVKNMKIFHLFILCKVDKENLFKNIPHSKKDLLGNQKTLILKSRKIVLFQRGQAMVWLKIGKFSCTYFRQNRQVKCF